MIWGMQDFDFAQILITFCLNLNHFCPNLPKLCPKNFLVDAATSAGPTALIPVQKLAGVQQNRNADPL